MGGLEIGITGLRTAQNSLDIIGNNIANAATQGYHRQEAEIRPNPDLYTNGIYLGQGADVDYVKRNINWLLDQEINSRASDLSQLERELQSLRSVESAFGELMTGGLSTAMDDFYNALHELSEEPTLVAYQSEVVSTAKTLANQFRSIGQVVSDLEDRTYGEAQEAVDDINEMTTQIADMNKEIYRSIIRGETPNNLMDRRDQAIAELSEIVKVTTFQREYGVVDVSLSDIPLVVSFLSTELEAGLVPNGDYHDLGVRISDTNADFKTNITGGRLGGLFNLRNDILRDVTGRLDTVAKNLIDNINENHVQGIGTSGSFQSLTGWYMDTLNLDEMVPPVQNGLLNIRVTDDSGNVRRGSVAINITGTTLNDVATDITNMSVDFGGGAIQPLLASVAGGKLEISLKPAYADYKFDFLPGVLQDPTSSALTTGPGGEAVPTVEMSGVYSGSSDNTYTFTVAGSAGGYIGTGDLTLQVSDLSGPVKTISIGSGYELGSRIEVAEGIYVTLKTNGSEPGYVNIGEDFTVEAVTTSDTSGLLKSVGLNTFFKGASATTIDITEDVESTLGLLAVALGGDGSDNNNVLRMSALGDEAMTDLDGLSQKQYYTRLATDVGSQIATTELKQENTFGIWRSLSDQRDDTSGVDVNDEAAKMLMYERMYQSMAKYMKTVNQALNELMGIL